MKTNTKEKIKELLKEYLLGIFAGFCISLGGIAFLSAGNKIAGSLFFTIGLFLVLIGNFNLFTGKVCYVIEKGPRYIYNLICIWLGNLTGALTTGGLLRATRLISLEQKCIDLCSVKADDSLISLLILGVFCNILIFVAVHGFNNSNNNLVKFLSLFFGVSVFVLCGFEHCVADMFYFSFAWMWNIRTIGCLLVITLGNIIGGVFAWFVFKKISKRQ